MKNKDKKGLINVIIYISVGIGLLILLSTIYLDLRINKQIEKEEKVEKGLNLIYLNKIDSEYGDIIWTSFVEGLRYGGVLCPDEYTINITSPMEFKCIKTKVITLNVIADTKESAILKDISCYDGELEVNCLNIEK